MSTNNRLIITNNTAWFIWIFTVIWVTVSLIFIDLAIRQPENLGLLGQLFIFSITGIGSITLLCFSYNQYIIKTIVDNNECMVYVTKTFIRKKERLKFSFHEIDDMRIEVTKDSDGDPYYHLNIYSSFGDVITIKEANYKNHLSKILSECETVFERDFSSLENNERLDMVDDES